MSIFLLLPDTLPCGRGAAGAFGTSYRGWPHSKCLGYKFKRTDSSLFVLPYNSKCKVRIPPPPSQIISRNREAVWMGIIRLYRQTHPTKEGWQISLLVFSCPSEGFR